jgi:O-antigen/teichoic acid export membrane protein
MGSFKSGGLGSLLRGSLLVTAASAAINFAAGIALARLCGPGALGQFVLLVASAHLAFAILSPGFDQAYIQKPNDQGRWAAVVVLTVLQGALLLSVPIALLALLARFDLQWMPKVDLMNFAWVMLGITFTLAANLLLAPLAVALDYWKISIVRLVAIVLAAVVAVAWAWWEPAPSATPLVAREVCSGGLLLALAFAFTRLPRWTGWPGSAAVRSTLKFSHDLWALNTLEKCVQRVEYLALGLTVSTTSVGVYFAIRSIFDGIYGVVSAPIQTVLFAYLCRDGRTNRLIDFLTAPRSLRILVPGGFGVALVGALSTQLFPLLLGPRYSAPWQLSAAFATLVAGLLLFELIKVAMMAMGRHRDLLPARGVQLLVLAVGVQALAQWAGLPGAAVGAMLATMALITTSIWQVRKIANNRR